MTLTKRLFPALILAVIPAMSSAHVTVSPRESRIGAWEEYDIRVPNEREVATTVLEVRFPAGLRIMSFEDKPGWSIEPVKNASGAITSARWTGQLPPGRFVEFGIIGVNPKMPGILSWEATQTYADGTVVRWSGPVASKSPGPTITIK